MAPAIRSWLEYRVASHVSFRLAHARPFWRGLLVLLLALAVLAPAAAEAATAPRKYAGIVVDAKSGKVLYEHAADAPRYPASVTKVMTLYILFQELAAGNLSLSTKMTVSRHAASAVPTKLGLGAGKKISVEDAIKALVTLSANDISRVIAEHVSGSESKFAQRMTRTAHALGMTHTTYKNASGLPDSGQVTTVRDQAILGIAIYQHFPTYYEYFQTRSFRYGKRTYGNHNRLLGERGVDGIKTGYIRASGYNLLTAARKDGRHIVVVGFGFDTAGSRDSKIRELVRKYMPKARKGDYFETAMIPLPGQQGAMVQVASAQPVAPMPYPAFRTEATALPAEIVEAAAGTVLPEPELEVATLEPVTAAIAPVETVEPAPEAAAVEVAMIAPIPAEPMNIGVQPALAAANQLGEETAIAPVPAYPSEDIIGAWISESLNLGAAPAELGETRPSAPLVPPVGIGDAGEPIDLMTSGSIAPPPAALPESAPVSVAMASQTVPLPPPPGSWVVQVGTATSEQDATALLIDAAGTAPQLGGFQPFLERLEKDGQLVYRARFAGFIGRDDAATICSALKQANKSCLAMQS
jgi:D-alanyl-D-alanine carboxypeptidase